jgi:hypothetical protein
MAKATAKKSSSIDDKLKRLQSRIERLTIQKQISDLKAKQKALK